MTKIEAVKKLIQERQKSADQTTVLWPHRADTTVNEFIMEGYMSCAFSTFIPTGAGDFLAPRERVVTVGNYFNHLVRYDDGKFARHPHF